MYAANPLLLEVHRAIDPGPPDGHLPQLPLYVARPHDRDLAEAVGRATAGSSAIATLVGGSSTGKTRACWEAVRELGDDWRLWHPISPGRSEALLKDIARVGPRTVIWLNEAQHYVAPPGTGEEAAARLRELLADPARGPVLVLATIWPRYWKDLTAEPVDGGADPHAQARALLAGSDIGVPDAFGTSAMIALRRSAADDPRLARAMADAEGKQITQYLAGVPALLARYRTASPTVKALMHAAMDARRLGVFEEWIPLEFLRDAAPGYLTELQWLEAGEGDTWLEEALREAAKPCKGVRGPLSPRKARTVRVGGEQGRQYRLADYLEQLGRTERGAEVPPETFWEAAMAQASADRVASLAWDAHARGLYRLSARMSKRALSAGATTGAARLAETVVMTSPGTADDAVAWIVRNANLSNCFEVWFLTTFLRGRQADGLVQQLLARAVTETTFSDASEVKAILDALIGAGGEHHVSALLARDEVSQVSLDNLWEVSQLLMRMKQFGADASFTKLADRIARSSLRDNAYLALSVLYEVGAERQLEAAVVRACDELDPTDTEQVLWLVNGLNEIGDPQHLELLQDTDLVGGTGLQDVFRVGWLLKVLHQEGLSAQLSTLIARVNAHTETAEVSWMAKLHVMARELSFDDKLIALLPFRLPDDALDLTDFSTVGWLLAAGRRLGEAQRVADLITRSAARPYACRTAGELEQLRETLSGWEWDSLIADVASAVAGWVPIEDAGMTAWVLGALRASGRDSDIAPLLARRPASEVSLDDPAALARFLTELEQLGREDEIAALLARGLGAVVPLGDSAGTADLLRGLDRRGAKDQVDEVAERLVGETDLADFDSILRLMDALGDLRREDQLALLAERVAAESDVTLPRAAFTLLRYFLDHGLTAAVPRLLSRIEADVATGAGLNHREERYFTASLLRLLDQAEAPGAVAAFASRLVATADFSLPGTTTDIAAAMRDAGAHDQVTALAASAADSGHFSLALQIDPELQEAFPYGREPDGTPSDPWTWHDQ